MSTPSQPTTGQADTLAILRTMNIGDEIPGLCPFPGLPDPENCVSRLVEMANVKVGLYLEPSWVFDVTWKGVFVARAAIRKNVQGKLRVEEIP